MSMESVCSNCPETISPFFFQKRTNLCWAWIFLNTLKQYELHCQEKELVYQNSEKMVHPIHINQSPQAQKMVYPSLNKLHLESVPVQVYHSPFLCLSLILSKRLKKMLFTIHKSEPNSFERRVKPWLDTAVRITSHRPLIYERS